MMFKNNKKWSSVKSQSPSTKTHNVLATKCRMDAGFSLAFLNWVRLCSVLSILLLYCSSVDCYAQCNGGSPSTPVTVTDETSLLPNSKQLVNGNGTTVNTTVPGQISIDGYPFSITTYSSSSAFTAATNTFASVTAATTINLPASGSVSSGAQIALTIGSQGTTAINAASGDHIIWQGSTTNTSISINNYDVIVLAYKGSGNWLVTSYVPMSGGGGGVTPITQGGTGATTAAGARSNLGAAASGANSDITSLTGLTTPLSVAQGGTGASTATGAINNLIPTQLSAAKGGTGVDGSSAANGQLLIGNGSGFSLGTLTQGSNVTITNSAGGITIASSSGTGTTVSALPKPQYGDNNYANMVVKLSTGDLSGWGDNSSGAIANGVSGSGYISVPQRVCFDPNTTLPPSSATITDWSFTSGNLYVVYSNGWVYSCGGNSYGQLGHSDTVARPFLKRIELFVTNSISINKVWAGASVAGTVNGGCVFFQSSTHAMYACGLNTSGNIPNGTSPTSNLLYPVACTGVGTSPYVTDVQMSSYGTAFSTFLVMSDHTLLVAGNNAFGQLGNGSTTDVTGNFANAKLGSSTNVSTCQAVRPCGNTNAEFTLMIDTSGNVYGTGNNGNGTLGLGNTTNKTYFTQATALSNITDLGVTGTASYCYAIDTSHKLWTWGYNGANNLFQPPASAPNPTPTKPSALSSINVMRAWLPKGESLSTNCQLAILTDTNQLMFAGTANGQISISNASIAGSYFIPMPRSFIDGTETISDLFVEGTSATQRWFILSNLGNLYACGSNTNSVCTGGVATPTPNPNAAWYKINSF